MYVLLFDETQKVPSVRGIVTIMTRAEKVASHVKTRVLDKEWPYSPSYLIYLTLRVFFMDVASCFKIVRHRFINADGFSHGFVLQHSI